MGENSPLGLFLARRVAPSGRLIFSGFPEKIPQGQQLPAKLPELAERVLTHYFSS
jgi:hypothetical protein